MRTGKVIDETGNKYGKLTVIRRDKNIGKEAAWLCACTCGKERVIRGNSLRLGRTRSCGCMVGKRDTPEGEASFNSLFGNLKRSAKNRGYSWNLSSLQLKQLTEQECHYCGVAPYQKIKNPWGKGDYVYNGIDRVDNSKGYTEENVVPCCGNCNRSKGTLRYTDFLKHIETIYFKHTGSKAESILTEAKVPAEGPDGHTLTLDERITLLWFAKKASFKLGFNRGVAVTKK